MNKLKITVCVIVLLSMINLVTAFGVSAPYWDAKPLTLHPGEIRDVSLTLQNMVGNKEVVLKASLDEGVELATLIDENQIYHVPFGVKDVLVNVRIHVPQDVSAGEQKIGVAFNQITEKDDMAGKMVQLGTAVKAYIPIVIEVPSTGLAGLLSGAAVKDIFSSLSSSALWLAVAGLVVLVIIIGFFLRRMRSQQ